MRTLITKPKPGNQGFQALLTNFLVADGLPFAQLISEERIHHIFQKHRSLFGIGAIYSTAIVLWAFLGQLLRDGKEASCQAAVAGIVSYRLSLQLKPPTADTGDYCRARAKLSEEALREITCEVGQKLQQQAKQHWLWKGRHAKLVDGFTFTMTDTPQNQAEYPQQRGQKPGLGSPIARACVLLSLATAAVLDMAFGPYKGKQTGETALLRELMGSLDKGDILVADRYYCSFMMIALLLNRGVDICATMHQSRKVDFRRGQRLGKYDHLITWIRPPRPNWMDLETYQSIPKTLVLREIRLNIVEPGCRTQVITIATTLIDANQYSKEDIAQLYNYRWNAELDIRSIKHSLNLNHVSCKSPEMVGKAVWVTLLGYNLIRGTAASAALLHGQIPREISFTGTCQYVLANWFLLASGMLPPERLRCFCEQLLVQIASCRVGHRPGRVEPRLIKRRQHKYKYMKKLRAQYRAELQKSVNGQSYKY